MNTNETNNGKGVRITWHWLAITLLGVTGWLSIQLWQMSNAQNAQGVSELGARLSADETKMNSISDDVTQIKSDVSYIKGLLQQRYRANQ